MQNSPFHRYAAAGLILMLATLLRWALAPVLGDHYPFVTYFGAMILAAWYGGLGPAALVFVGGALLGGFWFHSPQAPFWPTHVGDWIGSCLYLATALMATAVTGSLRTAKAQAEASEQRFRRLMDVSSVGIGIAETSGRVRYANPAVLEKLGYTAEEVEAGQVTWSQITPPEFAERTFFAIQELRSNRPVPPYEKEYIAKDGRRVPVLIGLAALERTAEREPLLAAFITDIAPLKQAEKALDRQKAQFEAIFNSTADALILVDPQRRIVLVNPAFTTLFGYAPEEVIGRTTEFLYATPDDYQEQGRKHYCAAACGQPFELQYRRKDGTLFWSESLATPVVDGDGMPIGFLGIHRDITDRKRLALAQQEQLRFLQAIIDAIPAPIFYKDTDGVYLGCNKAFQDFTGLDKEQVVGRSVYDVAPPHLADTDWKADQALLTRGGKQSCESTVVYADGTEHAVIFHRATFEGVDGDIGGVVGTLLDITERKHAEQVLQEVGRRKDEFLATLAHELRNPLAPIRNAFELIKRSADRPAMAEQALAIGERQVGQLVRLVDDLLDIARITRGKITLHKQPVRLDAVLQSAIETARPHIEAGGHRLTVEAPAEAVWLEADPTRLAQAVGNLLINAAKFTEADGRIRLAARREADGGLVVAVQDSGIGLPPGQLGKVFDLFAQIEQPRGRGGRGLGVGLALVKSLVELHGGRVEAASAGLGQGCTFTIRLPGDAVALADKSAHEAEAGRHSAPEEVRRILVVDDDVDVADSMTMLLSTYGHEVRTVYDGRAALEAAVAFRPDVVLLDIGMPGMDGYAVARQLRGQPALDGTLLVALTGWGQMADRQRARAAGFDHHLIKPADLNVLELVLKCSGAPKATARAS